MKLYTEEQVKDLNYWKNNAEEDYLTTPISVLRYISELEKLTPIELPSDEEIVNQGKWVFNNEGYTIFNHYNTVPSWVDGAKWMRDKILNK